MYSEGVGGAQSYMVNVPPVPTSIVPNMVMSDPFKMRLVGEILASTEAQSIEKLFLILPIFFYSTSRYIPERTKSVTNMELAESIINLAFPDTYRPCRNTGAETDWKVVIPPCN